MMTGFDVVIIRSVQMFDERIIITYYRNTNNTNSNEDMIVKVAIAI